ncbi:MAG: PaaI family thioesterase [bacterium]
MKKIINPFASLEGYNCFGCSQKNDNGLQLSFMEEGDEIVASWNPKQHFQGYLNVLHGGIQATLMDEIASWTVYVKVRTSGVTSRASLKYRKTVFIDKGLLLLRSRVVGTRKNLADIEVKLFDNESRLCAEGLFTFFTFSEEKSKKGLYYPGTDAFFEE